ncbi:dentin sialophosphoprotein [Episyrphus balteatus]|uniref:dentin sialophosphoprotein n=1 Tax=Episyrphus balteatus TaxID=286459 RepID=UPI0024869875|nr:dentin sialophosphoprotein [Episyrphus balteatus]
MHVNLDPLLVDKIANEVKSQGVFDQFRKDSMADVDTKPAYQNLRQRVENTVNKFLSAQMWTPEMNKNQLRERLRKHITEAGFLDVGVERIVDQVVNPKIATVFQPKIEDIAYKYLGIPKPQPTVVVTSSDVPPLNGILKVETDLLPTDLEQVSPDSDKCTMKSDSKDEMETDDKIDDFESPAFEPIENSNFDKDKFESKVEPKPEEVKEVKPEVVTPLTTEPHSFAFNKRYQSQVKDESSSEDWDADENNKTPPPEPPQQVKTEEVTACDESPGDATQESQLSQVSSDSRLSIVTNGNTQDEQSTACEIKEENNVNISEEAQMPKFNENSNSCSDQKPSEPLHFDIKKDEIKFEGTERKTEPPSEDTSPNISDEHRVDSSMENKTIDTSETSDIPLPSHEFSFEKDSDFKFSKIEVKVDLEEATKTTSLDDSADRELHIIEKSEMSQCSMSQNSLKSPMVKPKSPSATSSPLHSHQKSSSHRDKEHSSSRHKKYSKDRRSDRDKDKYSSSSHKLPSSSSSRHHSSKSSSSQRTPSDHHHHHHRSSSSSVHKSKSSSSRYSKSSRSHHDSKESRRSRDRSKSRSRSDKTRDKSSKDKSDRDRSKITVDDHYSSKHKWRKSTDSNDEDSSQEGSQPRGPKESSNSQDNGTNGTHNNSNTSSGTSSANNPNGKAGGIVADTTTISNLSGQKIVILDNLLKSPETNFIEIGNACVQVNSNKNQKTITTPTTTMVPKNDEEFLFYFENESKTKDDVETRINILTIMMENFRKLLKSSLGNSREPSTTESESGGNASHGTETNSVGDRQNSLSPVAEGNVSVKNSMESPNEQATLTSATLTIDCIQYDGPSISHCLTKRFKFDENSNNKVSPTSSELSVNSKENDFLDKNLQSDSDSLGSRDAGKSEMNKVISAVVKRKAIVNRNQRYSSEDLYKPRPILSQRSRRRGLDAVI